MDPHDEALRQRINELEARIEGAEIERDHFRVALSKAQARCGELETRILELEGKD